MNHSARTELQQRWISAVLLGSVTITGVLLLPSSGFAVALIIIVALAAWEWSALSGISALHQRGYYSGIIIITLALIWLLPPDSYIWLLIPVVLWWLIMTPRILRQRYIQPSSGWQPQLALTGGVVLIAPWLALVYLHQHGHYGRWLVLFLMLLIWFADAAAYFAGRRWGRRKLAPVISPGKTLEGVIGALVIAIAWSSVLIISVTPSLLPALFVVLLVVLTTFISIIGDLYESWLKRCCGVKDTSALLPGHGGILDRIDSMTAAAPLFVIGWLLLENTL